MNFRFIKAIICGLSITLMFMMACHLMEQFRLLCDEHFIVMEKRPPLANWMAHFLPVHAWQEGVIAPLIWLGFSRLAYQADHSLSSVVYRAFVALMFIGICFMAFPLIQTSKLVPARPVDWKNFVLPALSATPLLISFVCRKQKKS